LNSIYKLWEKLRDPAYRQAFIDAEINIGIPFQIRALAKARNWTQEELAVKAGMKQPRICDLMKPGGARPNIKTLSRIAKAFDCGLLVRFAPFSELVRWSEDFEPESFNVRSFGQDALTPASKDVADTSRYYRPTKKVQPYLQKPVAPTHTGTGDRTYAFPSELRTLSRLDTSWQYRGTRSINSAGAI
jgi:transcriptional regulator with XRE-family HTH domain